MPRVFWFFLVVVIGTLAVAAPMRGLAQPEPSSPANYVDLRKGVYEETGVLDQIPRAIPGLVVGFCAVLLLAGFFGFYEMGGLTSFALLVVIGTIIYRFYWHP